MLKNFKKKMEKMLKIEENADNWEKCRKKTNDENLESAKN